MGIDPVTHKPKNDAILISNDGESKNAANLSHMAQWESARLEAEARLVRQSKLRAGSSNSIQAQNSEFASTSTQLQKPVVPARCLDVLKAWNGGVWSAGGGGGDLGSPTSTLSSAAGVGESSAALLEFVGNSFGSCEDSGMMKDESEEEWKRAAEYRSEEIGDPIPFMPGLQETSSFPSEWASESMRGNSEHVPSGNFVEKFTDLLLSTSSGDRRFSEDGGESDNGSGSGGGGSGDFYEDNKNYWNSILNLVNSSPSHSPIF